MEKLGPEPIDYGYRPPIATYIEKSADLKAAKVGKSILKSGGEQSDRPAKNLRFKHEVIHKQTFGRMNDKGTYEVLVKITRLPLIDEHNAEEITTKEKITRLECEIANQRKLMNEGEPVDSKELHLLEKNENILKKMDSLFDGRKTLPFKLPKTSPRDFQREDAKLSAGRMTNTSNQSTIRIPNSPSWEIDTQKQAKIEKLLDDAMNKIPPGKVTPKQLFEIMLELRDFNKREKMNKDDLYSMYIDFDQKKEKFRSQEVIEQLQNTPTAVDRQAILNRFYKEELLPMETMQSVDDEKIKELLEENLDVILDDALSEAAYSDITANDIVKFIKKIYRH